MNLREFSLLAFLPLIVLPPLVSQTTTSTIAASALTAVPPLVPYSGQVAGRTGQASVTFLIYRDQQGGEPLFTESQIISFDEAGRYQVHLGAANPHGLPVDLFSTGEARWLDVQIAGQPEQPRVLLASVPYALKAADAATLGGLPASAFALASSNTAVANLAPGAISPDAAMTVTTTGGTANKLAKFSGANTIVNSILYDNGTEVGIGTVSPTATLTVDGTVALDGATTFNGSAVLNPTGTATSTHSYNSQLLKAYTSAYNSSTKAVVQPRFEWQAEPLNNNSSAPTGTLNLLSSTTSAGATETGFHFNADGTIQFTPGQIFDATSSTGVALLGSSTSNSGIIGFSESTTAATAGVTGYNTQPSGKGIGVYGGQSNPSATGLICKSAGVGAGVWGDSGFSSSYNPTYAVMGSADDQVAGYFINNSPTSSTLYSMNKTATQGAPAAYMGGMYGFCTVDTDGDLLCSGSKSAVVPVDNNTRKVALYAVESPENWFEDFGFGQLSNGVATVKLEPVFVQTVNLGVDYHVFLTPNGDSRGLYVSSKTAASFEVRESGSGRSTVAFDYRIVARRKGYETVRVADKTKQQEQSRSPLMLAAQPSKQTKQ